MEAEALILAGGKSSRMSGEHKGGLKLGTETFLEHQIKEFEKVTDKIWISYGEKVHGECPGCKIVMDEYQGCGPIGGVHAALKKTTCQLIFTAACDMPFLEAELYEYLCHFLEENIDAVVPVVNGKIHPLASIYKKRIFPVLEKQIAVKNYKITAMLEMINVCYVEVSEYPDLCRMLQNINTKEEYEKILKEEIWKD